jgi:hypothetical protein
MNFLIFLIFIKKVNSLYFLYYFIILLLYYLSKNITNRNQGKVMIV